MTHVVDFSGVSERRLSAIRRLGDDFSHCIEKIANKDSAVGTFTIHLRPGWGWAGHNRGNIRPQERIFGLVSYARHVLNTAIFQMKEPKMTPAEKLADQILRAAGSGLQHYTPQSKEKILKAADAAISAVKKKADAFDQFNAGLPVPIVTESTFDVALSLLQRWVRDRPAFRSKPVGAENSFMRSQQQAQIDLEDETMLFLQRHTVKGE